MKKFKVTDETHHDMHVVEITEGEFTGCKLVYNEVKLDEEHEDMLSFDYEIVNGFTVDKSKMNDFVNCIGDNLVSLIEESLSDNSLIYKGGV